jgi:hypothetical protein
MDDEKLTRLLAAACEWSSAAVDLARSQDLSIAANKEDVTKNTLEIVTLSDDAKNYRHVDMWIKGIEVFAAVVSLIVAVVVGYAATRLSAEANGCMFEVNLDYLGLIAHSANQFPGDEKKAADELSTLCKLPDSDKTRCDTLTEALSPFAKEAA